MPIALDQPRRAGSVQAEVRLPSDMVSPGRQLLWRLVIGLGLIVFVAMLAYTGREGYTDSADGEVDLLDAFYYATVAITTTGYGDIAPVTDTARLDTTLFVTPARIAFLVLLVGTSVELIAAATRRRLRSRFWRRTVQDHVVICGFGVKGRAALLSLREQELAPDKVVVVDDDASSVDSAVSQGHVGIVGDMTNDGVLSEAGVARASAVIVAPSRDDTAVLTVLSARTLNPNAHIVAAARETENAPLLRRSGANVVLTSAGSTGRMLGLARVAPHAVAVIEDLLELGRGFDLVEREVQPGEDGLLKDRGRRDELVLALFRDDVCIARGPKGGQRLEVGDRLVSLTSSRELAGLGSLGLSQQI